MNMMTKLGGRKFLMALIVIAVAIFLEISGRGLSVTMAGFLAGVLTAFSAANYASTSAFEKSKNPSESGGEVDAKLDLISQTISEAFNPRAMENLTQLLSGMNQNISQVQETTGQVAKAVVNLAKRG